MSQGTQGAQQARAAAKKRTAAKNCKNCKKKCNVELPKDPARREAALTLFGEASHNGPNAQAEREAIASVMKNRVAHGGYGGKTLMGVVTAPNQFVARQDKQYAKAKEGNLDPKECENLQKSVDTVNNIMDGNVPDDYKNLHSFRTAGTTRERPGGMTLGGNYFW